MLSSISIILAAFLFWKADYNYKAASLIILCEFCLHKLVWFFGVYLTEALQEPLLYLVYAYINLIAILMLVMIKSHFAITGLILINLSYNVLTISQYSIYTYDYYGFYSAFIGAIMIMELVYMGFITGYVQRYLLKRNDSNSRNMVFKHSNNDTGNSLL